MTLKFKDFSWNWLNKYDEKAINNLKKNQWQKMVTVTPDITVTP